MHGATIKIVYQPLYLTSLCITTEYHKKNLSLKLNIFFKTAEFMLQKQRHVSPRKCRTFIHINSFVEI